MYCAAAHFGAFDDENFDSEDVPPFEYDARDSMAVDQTQAQLCASTGDQDYEYSAPKFIDLSTVNAGSVLDDDASSNDDHWFERVHPLHESRRPRKPLRSLLTGSPGDAKASPTPSDDNMDGDLDSSQRKRQRSCSCESDMHAKRRLQQTAGPSYDNDESYDSDAGDMNVGDDNLTDNDDSGDDEILAMIATHNASKHSRQAAPASWNSRVGLKPHNGNLQRSRKQTRSARKRHTRSRRSDAENEEEHEAEISALIAAHNQKFRPKYDYAPPQHSVRDVKAWEAETGQRWYKLSPNSRIKANDEISWRKRGART